MSCAITLPALLCFICSDVPKDFQLSVVFLHHLIMAKGSFPSKEHIAQVFSNVGVGNYDAFFSYVVPDVGQYIIPVSKIKTQQYIHLLRNFGG